MKDPGARMRVIIVDDEALARERIRTLLAGDTEIEIAEECVSGDAAVKAIRRHAPDLLFLDVQMPRLDGFGVLEQIGSRKLPTTIFVTAFDQYAIRAFDAMALDYLLKPFTRERFHKALHRAMARVRQERAGSFHRQLDGLLDNLSKPYIQRLVIETAGRITFLSVGEIHWIEAQGNYACLHIGVESHLLRRSLKKLSEQLDPAAFLRIHRSTIVNIDQVQELQPLFHGEYAVTLKDGTRLSSSRGLKQKLERLFG